MINRRGVTLIEVTIASLIFIGTFVAFLRFSSLLSKQVSHLQEKSQLNLALNAIEKDVTVDMGFLPPQEMASGETIDTLLADADRSGTRCYDKLGSPLVDCSGFEADATARFKATFVKVRNLDGSISDTTSPLAKIPVSLVHFNVDYKVENTIQVPSIRFTRVLTDVLRF